MPAPSSSRAVSKAPGEVTALAEFVAADVVFRKSMLTKEFQQLSRIVHHFHGGRQGFRMTELGSEEVEKRFGEAALPRCPADSHPQAGVLRGALSQ